MSSLSQFAPFAGGGLKSFQTGYFNASATDGSPSIEDSRYADVTVSSVSTTKTIPCFYGSGSNNPPQFYEAGNTQAIVIARLTSSTNLRLSAAWNTATSFRGRWQLAEAN